MSERCNFTVSLDRGNLPPTNKVYNELGSASHVTLGSFLASLRYTTLPIVRLKSLNCT